MASCASNLTHDHVRRGDIFRLELSSLVDPHGNRLEFINGAEKRQRRSLLTQSLNDGRPRGRCLTRSKASRRLAPPQK